MEVETSCRSVCPCMQHTQADKLGPVCTLEKEKGCRQAAARPRTLATLPAEPRQSRDRVIEFATAHWLAWYRGSAELIGLQIK